MKRKLEFPLFYLFWVAVCISLVTSLGVRSQVVVMAVGVAVLVSISAYVLVASCEDDLIYALLRPAKSMLLLSVLGYLLCGSDIVGVLFALIAVLVILRVERGYMYGDYDKS